MIGYLLRQLGQRIVLLFIVSVISHAVVYLAPASRARSTPRTRG